MSTLPIVRFSEKKYLEQLQCGELFLRHNMYYQRLESEDTARSDPYDGSLPFPDEGLLSKIAGEAVFHSRKMSLTAYVICFYHYHCVKNGHIYIPEEDKAALLKFKSPYGLIINVQKLEERLAQVYSTKNIRLSCDDMHYYSDAELQRMIGEQHNGKTMLPVPPQYLKSDTFKNQSEYRICVNHQPDVLRMNPGAMILNQNGQETEKLYKSTHTLQIGSIKEFSVILPTEKILNSVIPIIEGD